MRTLLIVFLFLNSLQLWSERPEIHCKHFFKGYPYGTPSTNDLIIRDIYALSSNDSTKFADWVAYILTPDNLGDAKTSRNWAPDPWLDDDETIEPEDYKDANKLLKTDRGHQAPLADFKGTDSWNETNYLSNITPQSSDLNQGPWRILEDRIRGLLDTYELLYVMTGPLYQKEMAELPGADEAHKIPSGYWKIIVIPVGNDNFLVFSFIMEQDTPRNSDFRDYVVSVDEIEERSGLDFFWELEESLQNRIESRNYIELIGTIFK